MIGQRQRQLLRIGAGKGRAAEHQVDREARDIGHQPLPEELQCRRAVAIGFQNAGTAEFQQALARVSPQHIRHVEFARGVETAGARCIDIARQTIGPDDERLSVIGKRRTIDDEQVIADIIELVEVAPLLAHLRRRHRRHLFVEDVIAQTLRLLDFGFGFGKTHFQRARDSQHGPLRKSAFKSPRLVNIDQATGSFWDGADLQASWPVPHTNIMILSKHSAAGKRTEYLD